MIELQQVSDYNTPGPTPMQGQWVEYCYNAQGQLQALLYYQAEHSLTQKDSLLYVKVQKIRYIFPVLEILSQILFFLP